MSKNLKCSQGSNFLYTYSYYIPDQYVIWNFDPESHKRSLEVTGGQKEVKFKYSPSDSIFGMHSHMISLTNISCKSLTSKVIWGHQRSLEVKRRSTLKCSPRDLIFGMHSHMISLTNICYDILTSKVIRCHQRSLEVTGGQNWKIHSWTPFLACILIWNHWPI